MNKEINKLHTVITERLGSETLSKALYILLLLKLLLCVGIGYIYFNRKARDKAKKLNDIRLREIRENQMKNWEKERNEYLSSSNNENCLEQQQQQQQNEDKQKKKSTNKLSWMSANSNSHLNPHFSYLSTYKPSVSKRYPCKKCCG